MKRQTQPPPPRMSVVIPTYNRSGILERAVGSVLNQQGPSFEVLVVDDGSTDATCSVIGAIDDPRLRYLSRLHRGVSAARNQGAAAARGTWLVFLDSDDEAHPGWLESLGGALEVEGTGVVCCGAAMVGLSTPQVLPHALGPAFAGYRGLFLAGTFALRRDLFATVGGYAEDLTHSENTELALRLLPECRRRGLAVAAIDRALVTVYREAREAPPTARQMRSRLAASEHLLARHGRALATDPSLLATFVATGGVCAARLGDFRRARRLFRIALASDRRRLRHFGRLVLAWLPPLGRRVWRLGAERGDGPSTVVAGSR